MFFAELPEFSSHLDMLQIQGWRYIPVLAASGGAGDARLVHRKDRGVCGSRPGKTEHGPRGDGAIEGPVVCQIWEEHQLRDLSLLS